MSPALGVLDGEPTECECARGVVAAAVGHDERRVRAARRVELDGFAIGELVDWFVEGYCHRQLLLPLWGGGPEKDKDRGEADHNRGGQKTGHPPAEERSACESRRRSRICHPTRILAGRNCQRPAPGDRPKVTGSAPEVEASASNGGSMLLNL